jgi:anaerobic selenocysteine-containing dehydrogenase
LVRLVKRTAFTSCRICAGQCGLRFELDDAGEVIRVRGDSDNPVTLGYACRKGITLHEAHRDPARLLHPLRRQPDGRLVRIGLKQALDEIASRLKVIIAESGPDAVAGFRGTMSYCNLTANHMLPAWLASLGSSSFFSTMTIDQSAKWVTFERLGGWAGGRDPLDSADVLMWVGTNPLVSLSTFNFDLQHPVQRLRDAKARGLKLVVIDPRRSETARHADVFLQPLPGEDVTVVAGLLNLVLTRGWQDDAFCSSHADGVAELARAVSAFTPDYVSTRAGIAPAELERAAALFAEPLATRRKRGSAASGTGPNMGPHSNLAEHLVECLNVICGRYAQEGDPVQNPGVLGPRFPRRAQVIPPRRGFCDQPLSRVRGLGRLFGEKMTGALADEILTPGVGRVRALFVDGGNPVIALPDQAKTERAFRTLDLLVVIDPYMTATARLADYVLPPRMMLERHDLGSRDYEVHVMQRPYAQYAEPVLRSPPGAELIDDWEVFYEVARRLGVTLTFDGIPLDMESKPDTESLLRILTRHSSVSFDELRAATRGRIFQIRPQSVEAAEAGANGRFMLGPEDVIEELRAVRAEPLQTLDDPASFRLAARRLRDVQNTMYHDTGSAGHRPRGNLAYVHPADLQELGLAEGQLVVVESKHGEIALPARSDASLRRRVVSIAHGWGDLLALPATDTYAPASGANTNRLTSASEHCEPINAMPCLTGLPVRLRAHMVPTEGTR